MLLWYIYFSNILFLLHKNVSFFNKKHLKFDTKLPIYWKIDQCCPWSKHMGYHIAPWWAGLWPCPLLKQGCFEFMHIWPCSLTISDKSYHTIMSSLILLHCCYIYYSCAFMFVCLFSVCFNHVNHISFTWNIVWYAFSFSYSHKKIMKLHIPYTVPVLLIQIDTKSILSI